MKAWRRIWMRFSGRGLAGRFFTRLAVIGAPRHKDRVFMASLSPKGYFSPKAVIQHARLRIGRSVFVDDEVVLFQRQRKGQEGGEMRLDDKVMLYRGSILETGFGGTLRIGKRSSVHPRCQINAYLSSISIGEDVMLAPKCSLYSYDHQTARGTPIASQPMSSKGGIVIGNGAWLGVGATVTDGVTIGEGAVIAAGALVVSDVPSNAVASGVPARVVGFRQ